MNATTRSTAILSIVLTSACADLVPEPTGVVRRGGDPARIMLAGTWLQRAPLPTARYYAVGAVHGGKLYVIGGVKSPGPTPSDACERYDPATNSWSTCAPLPSARFGASAVTIGNKIYVFGGVDPDYLVSNSVFIYSPANNSWSTGAPMVLARYTAGAAAINGKAWVFGGLGESFTDLASVEVYDPALNSWNVISAMPEAGSMLKAFAANGLIYVVSPTRLDSYDANIDWWTARAASPLGSAPSGGVVGGMIYLLRTIGLYEAAYGYDPSANQWNGLGSAPGGAIAFQSASGAIDGTVYSAGGYDGGPTDQVWAFTPSYAGNHRPEGTINGPWRTVEGGGLTFIGTGSDPDNDALTYSWDFGDGDTDNGTTVFHAYDDDGEYQVTLTISDGDKARVLTARAFIRNVKPTVSGILTTTINAGQSYVFTGTITDPGDETFTATVNWGEGGGVQPYPVTGNAIALNHQYNTPGYYFITVTINDGDGGVITVNRQVRVKPVT